MVYERMAETLQTNASGFIGNLIEGVFAFSIFVVILFIGLFVANLLGSVLRTFFERVRMEKWLEKHGVHDAFVGFTLTNITVTVLKIYVVVAFLGIAADTVSIPMLTFLAAQAAGYLPLLVQGLVILLVGLAAGDYITDRIKASKKIPFANTAAIVIELFIAYNALVIAMPLLLPAADPSLLIWSFLVLLAAVALALGLGVAIAIGLGMKDVFADVARKHKSKLESLL